ncbi:MAG: AlpA family phage regulatory protein [Alphaproteobacteria bacterium]|nr:AlpA family phage regulatory protein [Alphaproteobacteria bacterium]
MQTKLSDLYDLPRSGFLRQSELIPEIIPFSAATLWRKVKSGEFPRPVKLSERITAWRAEDVRAWMDKLVKTEC